MEFIPRALAPVLLQDLKTFPVLTVTGPRQSGKSTLLQHLLPDWSYINLEDRTHREFAESDPKGFLENYRDKVVFDEIQRTPQLLSDIQVAVDKDRRPGRFVLTGSHNLLLLESVSQSLSGRTAIRNLLPFSFDEISPLFPELFSEPHSLESVLYRGGYPLAVSLKEDAHTWLQAYVQTYIERDVRLIRNVSNLATFEHFVRMAASRAGQLLDLSSIGNDIGVTHNTIKDWLGILEVGFICFRLSPYFRNYAKRLIKSPKLYFYDTGLLCTLLNIRDPEELITHPFRGAIFENWCIAEGMKAFLNSGRKPRIFFWRDKKMEVDMLVERTSTELLLLECKSGRTPQSTFLDAPNTLKEIMTDLAPIPAVVYGAEETQKRSQGTLFGWKDFALSLPSYLQHGELSPHERE